MMSSGGSYSLVLAANYRVSDISGIPAAMEKWRSRLASNGIHHVVFYTSNAGDERVFVTVGIRQREPVKELLRSRVIFDWFDDAGIEDLPAVFAGETVEKIDTRERPTTHAVSGTIVAVMASVADVSALMDSIHGQLPLLRKSGVNQLWVYRAFDDEHEVLMLHDVENEELAQLWIDHPAKVAEWMESTGLGPYPQPFVGSLAHVFTIEAPG